LQSKQLPADDYAMSDHTRRTIDEEQQYLTDLAHRSALKLVGENRPLLEAFAFTLLDNEVLERHDIDRIMSAYRAQHGKDAAPAPAAEVNGGPARVAAAKRLPPAGTDSPA